MIENNDLDFLWNEKHGNPSRKFLKDFKEFKLECEKTIKYIDYIERYYENNLTSKLININASGFNFRSQQAVKCVKQINNDLYSIYNELSKKMEFYSNFWEYKLKEAENSHQPKNNHLKKELLHLSKQSRSNQSMTGLENTNIVFNFSNVEFTREQLEYLNKGPHYRPVPSKPPLDEIIVSIESGMKKLNIKNNDKFIIRDEIEKIIKNIKKPSGDDNEEVILEELKQKCYQICYTTSDEGNKIVIMNKVDYEKKIIKILCSAPYKRTKIDGRWSNNSPLTKMRRDVKTKLDYLQGHNHLSKDLVQKNPMIPEIYGIPKLHEYGYTMTLNCSRENEITSKINDYILEEFEKLNLKSEFAVTNSIEFVERISREYIEKQEIMVCYDFSSLFLNISKVTLKDQIHKYLRRQNIDKNLKELLEALLYLSIDQKYICFQKNIFEQDEGIAVGSKLSNLIKDIYMCNFEDLYKKSKWFPVIWYRCVDQVFGVVEAETHIKELKDIKITYENEASIKFLDLLVKRKNKKFKFSIYGAPTENMRYIMNDSFHSTEEKHSWLHFLIQRLISIPMDESDYHDEWNKIINIAQYNGYSQTFCDDILRCKKKEKQGKTANTNKGVNSGIISIPFYPPLTDKIQNILKGKEINLIYTNPEKTFDILGPNVDKRDDLKKSGIYMIKCQKCQSIYIGQTIRSLEEREKDHEKSDNSTAVTIHRRVNAHKMEKMKLLKSINDEDHLDAWESLNLYKYRSNKLMNVLIRGNLPSSLYQYC